MDVKGARGNVEWAGGLMAKKKYRSGLEVEIARQLRLREVPFSYEEKKIPYTVPATKKNYTPDFVIKSKSGKEIIIEGKGLWVVEDRYKHLLIRQQKPELDIRFVFSNSKKKIRKGSKTTYADICEGKGRRGFKGMKWKYADKKIPKEWLEE